MSLQVDTYETLSEAASAMDARARYLGGGTLVMRAVNYGDPDFDRIVRVRERGLDAVTSSGNRIVLGAHLTMAGILGNRDLGFLHPVARAVGGPAVRAMATVGGNLFAAHPYGDMATALLALDGVIEMADGTKQPIDRFLVNRAGLVRSVEIARPQGDAFRWRKMSRVKPKGVSVMAIAAHLNRSAGRLSAVRVAYGAMADTPVRVPAVEQALEGASLDASGIARALGVATDGLDPPTDALASGWYRREVAPVQLRRLLLGEDR